MGRWQPGGTAPYGSPQDVLCDPGPASGEKPRAPDEIHHELVARVEKALGRFATPGQVELRDDFLQLHHAGACTRAPLGAWADRWDSLEPAMKESVATDLARELSQSRAQSSAPSVPERAFFVDPKVLFLGVATIALLSYAWVADVFRSPRRASGSPDDVPTSITKEESTTGRALSTARVSRTCATTLSRVLQGGTVSGADAEGWVVEIALLSQGSQEPLHTHPQLTRFVEDPLSPRGSRFSWSEVEQLETVETPDTVVRITRSDIPARSDTETAIPGVTISFDGTYVDAYFSEDKRAVYHRIASNLSDALSATHTAVYARCFDSTVHTLGSWFRGLDEPGAVTSLLYFIGTFAEPPHLARPFYRPPDKRKLDPRFSFDNIISHAARLDRKGLATLAGAEGGMALGKGGEGVLLTFPFTDGNRASRMSRTTARVLGLNR